MGELTTVAGNGKLPAANALEKFASEIYRSPIVGRILRFVKGDYWAGMAAMKYQSRLRPRW
jgi:hypothetical protein